MTLRNEIFLKDILVFDAHCDTANKLTKISYNFKKNSGHLDLEKIFKGGLKAQIFALYVNPIIYSDNSFEKALIMLESLKQKIFSQNYGIKVNSIAEMNFSLDNNFLACWIFIEGGHIIENSFDKIDILSSIGIKGITLTHNKNTDWADSSFESPRWNGLNELGIKILKKLEELKLIIDISHASDKTVEDVLDYCRKPIMASHSNSRKLCNIKRNLPDNLISEIGNIGGYIGVNFFPGFLKKDIYNQIMKNYDKHKSFYNQKIQENKDNPSFIRELEDDFNIKMVENIENLDLNSVIDHIVHISEVGGIDCVGLGSDFDGIPSTPKDLKDVSFYPNLINGLIDRGFNFNEIKKIMGLNLYNYIKKFD
jgi:membrane dipeptidase